MRGAVGVVDTGAITHGIVAIGRGAGLIDDRRQAVKYVKRVADRLVRGGQAGAIARSIVTVGNGLAVRVADVGEALAFVIGETGRATIIRDGIDLPGVGVGRRDHDAIGVGRACLTVERVIAEAMTRAVEVYVTDAIAIVIVAEALGLTFRRAHETLRVPTLS